ncbi:uncharacterized protein AMSG_05902 [Thecamonas trahens ATCC 50062]|uniref:Uncharacterized protein n=1 Tax=Thecamonas trahens ATCC 50062 TaxID=461836 RepID=A0A0L0DFP8_THETB|nr:hypothetical protein AMSG_05902 [Thecamonas trahens ATCC 50062]KNC50128.1 hypothetical protein AMSG_05902 [Thecamonas trahens ATCC 50062]|eukprot:XP_013757285.1 hypothetical protein AMSG_05902 [Thecamonas trahens ATCC 50062]
MLQRVARAEWRRAGGGESGDIPDSIGARAASKSETDQVVLNEVAKQIKDLVNAIVKQAMEAADTIRERESSIHKLTMQLASAGIMPATMATNVANSSRTRTDSEKAA